MEWKRTWPRYIRECQILCLTWIIRIFGICFVQPKGLESSYSTQEEFYFILDLVYRFLFSLEKLDRSFLSLSLSNRRDREKLDRIDSSTTTASTIPLAFQFFIHIPRIFSFLEARNGCRNSSSSKTWARVSNASCRVTAPPRVRSRARDFSGEKSIEKFDWTDLSLGK